MENSDVQKLQGDKTGKQVWDEESKALNSGIIREEGLIPASGILLAIRSTPCFRLKIRFVGLSLLFLKTWRWATTETKEKLLRSSNLCREPACADHSFLPRPIMERVSKDDQNRRALPLANSHDVWIVPYWKTACMTQHNAPKATPTAISLSPFPHMPCIVNARI